MHAFHPTNHANVNIGKIVINGSKPIEASLNYCLSYFKTTVVTPPPQYFHRLFSRSCFILKQPKMKSKDLRQIYLYF